MKRAIVIVIDSLGVGAMSDAALYNDSSDCNTLGNIAKASGGISLPVMQKLGVGNIIDVQGTPPIDRPIAQYGIMEEKSQGKDTTTGHWEMMGLILDEPFKVYPNGFPEELINEFIKKTDCKGILGNYPASGTAIIEKLHIEHEKTKFPIIYTSADSVFQIAADIDVIPLEKIYEYSEIARKLLVNEYNVSRVIARPYHIVEGKPTRISKYRHDYSVKPTKPTLLNEIVAKSGTVIGIGKIEDIFVKEGITHAVHTGSNREGLALTLNAIKNELNLDTIKVSENITISDKFQMIFTNLVDTDMLYGHRNDVEGYKNALIEIDTYLQKILDALTENDLLIVTADHGCDPTVEGTDHTREKVPVMVYHKNIVPKQLDTTKSFSFVADICKNWIFEIN